MTHETASKHRHLPDPAICRTSYLIYGLGFTRCLVQNPDACEFAERSPAGFYCEHPDRREFDHSQTEVHHQLPDEVSAAIPNPKSKAGSAETPRSSFRGNPKS